MGYVDVVADPRLAPGPASSKARSAWSRPAWSASWRRCGRPSSACWGAAYEAGSGAGNRRTARARVQLHHGNDGHGAAGYAGPACARPGDAGDRHDHQGGGAGRESGRGLPAAQPGRGLRNEGRGGGLREGCRPADAGGRHARHLVVDRGHSHRPLAHGAGGRGPAGSRARRTGPAPGRRQAGTAGGQQVLSRVRGGAGSADPPHHPRAAGAGRARAGRAADLRRRAAHGHLRGGRRRQVHVDGDAGQGRGGGRHRGRPDRRARPRGARIPGARAGRGREAAQRDRLRHQRQVLDGARQGGLRGHRHRGVLPRPGQEGAVPDGFGDARARSARSAWRPASRRRAGAIRRRCSRPCPG